VRVSTASLVSIAAICAVVTHWLTPAASQAGEVISPLLGLLVVPGLASPLLPVYPTIPWLGPTLLGVAFGKSLQQDRRTAFRLIGWTGAAFLVCFAALRVAAVGSFHPVAPGWIGFLNVTKYPPDVTFLLLTLGADFLMLAGIERSGTAASRWWTPVRVFGSVPLFFFVAHLWLYAAIGRLFPSGTSIPSMYPLWLLGLVVLYPPCRWYASFRQSRGPGSLFRLL